MKIFYSKAIELDSGSELYIPINNAEVGDVALSELWVNVISGSYSVDILHRDGEDMVSVTYGMDMDGFAKVSTGSETRMMYPITDACALKITALEDSELDIKVIY